MPEQFFCVVHLLCYIHENKWEKKLNDQKEMKIRFIFNADEVSDGDCE